MLTAEQSWQLKPMDNINASGSLDVDKFQRALLIYRNSIDPETKASPELVLFGRPIRDAIPIPLGRYSLHKTWSELMSHRELALGRIDFIETMSN